MTQQPLMPTLDPQELEPQTSRRPSTNVLACAAVYAAIAAFSGEAVAPDQASASPGPEAAQTAGERQQPASRSEQRQATAPTEAANSSVSTSGQAIVKFVLDSNKGKDKRALLTVKDKHKQIGTGVAKSKTVCEGDDKPLIDQPRNGLLFKLKRYGATVITCAVDREPGSSTQTADNFLFWAFEAGEKVSRRGLLNGNPRLAVAPNADKCIYISTFKGNWNVTRKSEIGPDGECGSISRLPRAKKNRPFESSITGGYSRPDASPLRNSIITIGNSYVQYYRIKTDGSCVGQVLASHVIGRKGGKGKNRRREGPARSYPISQRDDGTCGFRETVGKAYSRNLDQVKEKIKLVFMPGDASNTRAATVFWHIRRRGSGSR